MGWVRTLLLGDIGNRLDIADAEQDIEAIRNELDHTRRLDRFQELDIRQLRQENEQLGRCLGALLTTLARKKVLTGSEVRKLLDTIESQ